MARGINSLGYTIHHLSTLLDRRTDLLLQMQFNIGFSQFKILMTLDDGVGIQQKEIAELLGQTEASVSRQIKVLVDSNFVMSMRTPENKRLHLARLTPKGTRVLQDALITLESYHAPLFSELSEQERDHLSKVMTKLLRRASSSAI